MQLSDIPDHVDYPQRQFLLAELLDEAQKKRASWTNLRNDYGVYVVYFDPLINPEFQSHFGSAKRAVAPKNIEDLQTRWVDGAKSEILCIGKATSIRRRISQLCRFGIGRTGSHKGGKVLWQIKNIRNAKLMTQTCPVKQHTGFENTLLETFMLAHKGERPIANLEGPKGEKRFWFSV